MNFKSEKQKVRLEGRNKRHGGEMATTGGEK